MLLPIGFELYSFNTSELLSCILTGYNSYSENLLGLSSKEEAYEATQLAIWQIALEKGLLSTYTENANISSARSIFSKSISNKKVFDVAEELVNKTFEDNFVLNPTVNVVSEKAEFKRFENVEYNEETGEKNYSIPKYIVGPFSFYTDQCYLQNYDINIYNSTGELINDEIEIVDEFGNSILNKYHEREFYILVGIENIIQVEIDANVYITRVEICKNKENYYIYPETSKVNVKNNAYVIRTIDL